MSFSFSTVSSNPNPHNQPKLQARPNTNSIECKSPPYTHFIAYLEVVKSVSVGRSPPSAAFSQVQASAERAAQAQRSPLGVWFSVVARSQVQAPAGRARHEQRGPVILFSEADLAQVQLKADFSPQEHLAWVALWIVSYQCVRK